MNCRLNGKMFYLIKKTKRKVMERLNVDSATVYIDSNQNGWNLVFETPVDDTYAELSGILHSDGLEAVLRNFMRNLNVKWSTQEVSTVSDESYYDDDEWCYECNDYCDECMCNY